MTRRRAIAAAFGAAGPGYDDHAPVQRIAAAQLAARIARLGLPPRPRVLELGCGTGLLGAALAPLLPDASWLFTDLSPAMVATCRDRLGPLPAQFVAMDGARPALAGPFDLICSSFALQWFEDLPGALDRLPPLLAPGGWLAYAVPVAGSLAEWAQAYAACGLDAAMPAFPPEATLPGAVTVERVLQPAGDALGLLRALRGIGAATPRPGHRPHGAGALRCVMRAFDAAGAVASYRVASGAWRKPPRAGVFVTGTDTGVGKTLASAVLVRALGAEYWKPVQTGLAEEAGDTAEVTALAGCRVHPPRHALQAPLSPDAAGALEGVRIGLGDFALPAGLGPLVVEGAGGVLVPLNGSETMAELMQALGLPVVLVARSTLGTINHTLLSLEALRRRGIAVAGVVLNGPANPGNRAALERRGVRVLFELPPLAEVDAATVARLAEEARPGLCPGPTKGQSPFGNPLL